MHGLEELPCKYFYCTGSSYYNSILQIVHATDLLISKLSKFEFSVGLIDVPRSMIAHFSEWLWGLDKLFLFFYLLFYSHIKKFTNYSFQATHYSLSFSDLLFSIIPQFFNGEIWENDLQTLHFCIMTIKAVITQVLEFIYGTEIWIETLINSSNILFAVWIYTTVLFVTIQV